MRIRLGPKADNLESWRGTSAPQSKRATGCRLARFVGVAALAAVTSSCLPIGNALTSTRLPVSAEKGQANDTGATSLISGVAAVLARSVSSASEIELASVGFDPEDEGDSLADLNRLYATKLGRRVRIFVTG